MSALCKGQSCVNGEVSGAQALGQGTTPTNKIVGTQILSHYFSRACLIYTSSLAHSMLSET